MKTQTQQQFLTGNQKRLQSLKMNLEPPNQVELSMHQEDSKMINIFILRGDVILWFIIVIALSTIFVYPHQPLYIVLITLASRIYYIDQKKQNLTWMSLKLSSHYLQYTSIDIVSIPTPSNITFSLKNQHISILTSLDLCNRRLFSLKETFHFQNKLKISISLA